MVLVVQGKDRIGISGRGWCGCLASGGRPKSEHSSGSMELKAGKEEQQKAVGLRVVAGSPGEQCRACFWEERGEGRGC